MSVFGQSLDNSLSWPRERRQGAGPPPGVLGGELMSELRLPPVMKDPRYLAATRLFDMSGLDGGWAVPRDPHARDNLRHACGLLAADHVESATGRTAEEFLDLVLRQYIGDKYRDALRSDIRRIARQAARS